MKRGNAVALPAITGQGRGRGIGGVVASAVVQAMAAGVAAFATRSVFAALHAHAAGLPVRALATIATMGVVLALARVYERVLAERIGQDYAGELRLQLFEHITRMSSVAVAERRSGTLALRFVGDLGAVRKWVSQGVARLVSSGIVLPCAVLVMALLSPALALAAGVPIVLGLLAMTVAGIGLGPAHRRLRKRRARLASDMLERLPHAPELRLLGRIDIERARLARSTTALLRSALAHARSAATVRAIPDVVAGTAAAALLGTAFTLGIGAADAAGAMAALGIALHPLRTLADVWDRHRAWTVARDRCLALLARPTLPARRRRHEAPLEDSPPRLRFRDVDATGVHAFSARVPSGRKVAIVGPNGAGKSTLLRIAAGLEAPTAGKVTIGGRPPGELRAGERRRTIAHLGSHSPILAGSLRRALTMGSARETDDAALITAAHAFGLAPVLARLGGLDGHVAEGGRNLSAGEARRVLLARVALSGAQLWLLDEPEEALDADGIDHLTRLLRDNRATVLVATHNLALARRMDEVWVIEHGQRVDDGTPSEVFDGSSAGRFRPRAVDGPPNPMPAMPGPLPRARP